MLLNKLSMNVHVFQSKLATTETEHDITNK